MKSIELMKELVTQNSLPVFSENILSVEKITLDYLWRGKNFIYRWYVITFTKTIHLMSQENINCFKH